MRYQVLDVDSHGVTLRSVNVQAGQDAFVSFPAEVGNPNYDLFLESQGLTNAEVQAMEPDEWHDMASAT